MIQYVVTNTLSVNVSDTAVDIFKVLDMDVDKVNDLAIDAVVDIAIQPDNEIGWGNIFMLM